MSIVFDICLVKSVCVSVWNVKNESNNIWKIKLSLVAVNE